MKFEKKEPEVLENFYLKQKKLPEKARQFVIKLVEKRTELLIILQKETNFLKKEPEVLEKLK